FLAACVIFGLHEPAGGANKHAERIPSLRRGKVFSREIGIGRRCRTEIDKGEVQRCFTVAALQDAGLPCLGSKSRNPLSRSDCVVMARGQSIPSAISSARKPSSAAGT